MEPARKREKQHIDKKRRRENEREREREALVTVNSWVSQCAIEAGNCLIAHILAVHYKVRVGPLTLLMHTR